MFRGGHRGIKNCQNALLNKLGAHGSAHEEKDATRLKTTILISDLNSGINQRI